MSQEESARSRREAEAKNAKDKIGPLDLAILKRLSEKKGLGVIAKLTKVEPGIVGKKIAKLQTDGYVTASGYPTAKGFEALDEQHD